MDIGRAVFSQLMEFLPIHEFHKCIQKNNGNYKVQSFFCLDQFLCMAFAQTNLSRKSPRYRSKFEILRNKTLSYGHSREGLKKHYSLYQREKRLAHLYGFRSRIDPDSQKTLYKRHIWRRTRSNSLRIRLHHHRSLPLIIPLGTIPKN